VVHASAKTASGQSSAKYKPRLELNYLLAKYPEFKSDHRVFSRLHDTL